MSANSSSVRAAPEPKKRAHISTHGLPGCKANSRMPATTIPTRPNTEWWMCSPWVEMCALFFGSGAALTLDEFALILHLEDVYWTGEGRASIDAVILGVTFITLLLTGLTPRSIGEVGDLAAMSRWVGSGLILSGAAFVIVSYLKGKLFMGTVGIFVPPVAVIGALRLAKPSSPWAHRQYADNPGKLERARHRDEGFNRRWRQRKLYLWDVIGGKPHLRLPHRHGHHDDHGNDPGRGSTDSRI